MKRKWRCRLLEADVKLMTQAWMERELRQILAAFNSEELENLARSHYSEVISVLTEAVAHHDGRPDIQVIQNSGNYSASMDVGSVAAAERISSLMSSSRGSHIPVRRFNFF